MAVKDVHTQTPLPRHPYLDTLTSTTLTSTSTLTLNYNIYKDQYTALHNKIDPK